MVWNILTKMIWPISKDDFFHEEDGFCTWLWSKTCEGIKNEKTDFFVLFKIDKMQYNNYSHGRVRIFDRDVIISFCIPQPLWANYFYGL